MKKVYLAFLMLLLSLTASAQWGTELGVEPKPMGTLAYGSEFVMTQDGTIWYYYFHPQGFHFTVTEKTEDGVVVKDSVVTKYQQRLQAISKDGQVLFGDSGMVVSDYANRSWTQVNQYLYANSDNTVTLVVADCRNSGAEERNITYTAYRIRRDGTHVWDSDGVCLDEGYNYFWTACMTFCELSDGSTAFAWCHETSDGWATEIQKVSADGKTQYKLADTRLTKTAGYYTYPYMVPSDNGSFILVYAYSSNYYLRAMKYNSDGTKAWPSEVKVYGGGWGSVTSLQSRMKVYPTADHGVIVTWNDDRNNDGYYLPYLAYIGSDGTSRFTNENGKPDICLSYDEYSAYPPKIVFSRDGSAIYAVFNQFSQNSQGWQQLTLQKVDAKTGELLYGSTGVQILNIAVQDINNASVQLGEGDNVICFWQEFFSYQHIDNLYSIRNGKTGEGVDKYGKALDEEEAIVRFRESEAYRASLETRYSPSDNTILVYWEEDDEHSSDDSKTKRVIFNKMSRAATDVTDGIGQTATAGDSREARYGVTGQILSTLKKGDIYIQGGKKYVVK